MIRKLNFKYLLISRISNMYIVISGRVEIKEVMGLNSTSSPNEIRSPLRSASLLPEDSEVGGMADGEE